MNIKISEGRIVKIGDWVEFKSDIEQSGQIVGYSSNKYGHGGTLTLEGEFVGDYIGGKTQTEVPTDLCW